MFPAQWLVPCCVVVLAFFNILHASRRHSVFRCGLSNSAYRVPLSLYFFCLPFLFLLSFLFFVSFFVLNSFIVLSSSCFLPAVFCPSHYLASLLFLFPFPVFFLPLSPTNPELLPLALEPSVTVSGLYACRVVMRNGQYMCASLQQQLQVVRCFVDPRESFPR